MEKKKEQNEKMKELTEKLEAGVREVFSSDRYRKYLSAMQRFHGYSYNNTLLIQLQNPDASYVAGYRTWESLGRRVRKGEKAIYILAPSPYKEIRYDDVSDPNTGTVKRDPQGNPLKERKEVMHNRFRPAAIFDISQTEGEPLPELAQELQGQIEGYRVMMEVIRHTAPVPIRFEEWKETKKGHYDPGNQEIVLKAGMSELQTIKTAIHELAHSILHCDPDDRKDSMTMEVQAESVAYIVTQFFGLDTSDYSFGYIAGWSAGKEMPELRASLQNIQKASHQLIEQLEREFLSRTRNTGISNMQERMRRERPGLPDSKRHRR